MCTPELIQLCRSLLRTSGDRSVFHPASAQLTGTGTCTVVSLKSSLRIVIATSHLPAKLNVVGMSTKCPGPLEVTLELIGPILRAGSEYDTGTCTGLYASP